MASLNPLEDHVTCSVCFDIYKDPHALKCLHTYCLPCIKQLQRDSKVECPDCRKITNLNDIQKEFKVQSLIDLHNKVTSDNSPTTHGKEKCDVCSQYKSFQSKCTDCAQFLCKDCTKMHNSIKVCRNHEIVNVSDLIRSMKGTFNKKLDLMRELDGDITTRIEEIGKAMTSIDLSQEQKLNELKKHKQEMVDKIESHFMTMTEIVKTANDDLLQGLARSQNLCKEMRQNVKSTNDLLLEMAHSNDVLRLTNKVQNLDSDVKAQIEELRSRLAKVNVTVKSDVVVHKCADFKPEIYFTVTTTSAEALITEINYSDLLNKNIKEVKSEEMKDVPQRMRLINNNIWCAMYNKGIYIYNQECELLQNIIDDKIKHCSSITETHTGDIVVACRENHGLHLISHSNVYKCCIKEGCFADVCICETVLYALDYENCAVLLFKHDSKDSWSCVQTIKLQHSRGCYDDKLSINRAGIYVSSWKDNCLYIYNTNGEYLWKTGESGSRRAGLFDCARLCNVDHKGNALLCDWQNHRLQLYNPVSKQWSLVAVEGELKKPVDVTLSGKDVWILSSEKKVIKYL